jgi:hypothetical protein
MLVIITISRNPTPDGETIEGLPKWERFGREHSFYMHFSNENTLESNYREKFTVARDEGIDERSFAVSAIASPLLVLVAALYHLIH